MSAYMSVVLYLSSDVFCESLDNNGLFWRTTTKDRRSLAISEC